MPEYWIGSVLRKLCVPTNEKGYMYLNIIITLKLTYPQLEMPALYEQIALRYGVTVRYAKRKIREAIKKGYLNSDKEVFSELIGIFCKNESKISTKIFVLAVSFWSQVLQNAHTQVITNEKS